MTSFNPHPINVAKHFKPVLKPSIAFEIPSLFQPELEVLLSTQCSGQGKDLAALNNIAVRDFINLKREGINPATYLALYYQVLKNYYKEGNGDGVFDNETGYMKLVKSPNVAFILKWCLISAMDTALKSMKEKNPTMTQVNVEHDLDFLFTSAEAGPFFTIGGPSMYGIIPFDGEEDNSEELLEEIVEKLSETNNRLEDLSSIVQNISNKVVGENSSELEEVPEEEVTESKPKEKKKALTLEQIAERIVAQKSPTGKAPIEPYSIYWTSPPPLSLYDLYKFDKLTGPETAFLIDLYLDLFQSQSTLLSFHFLLRRLISIWNRSDTRIEAALFSRETSIIATVFERLSNQLRQFYSIKFLAMEGITVPGERTLAEISTLFKGKSKTILSITDFLDRLIEIVREGCLALDRLRVSLLYGKDHPSFVGEEFLKAYLYLAYQTRHAETAFENVLSIVEPLGALSLPKDNIKAENFYDKIHKRMPEEASKLGIVEPEARVEYSDGNTTRKSLGSTGDIKSLLVDTSKADFLYEILNDVWESPI